MALAQVAQATQPARIHELGEVHQLNRPILPVDQDSTPTALSPLRRQNPREEPGALAAHAGICAGGEERSSSLPRPLSRNQHLGPALVWGNIWLVSDRSQRYACSAFGSRFARGPAMKCPSCEHENTVDAKFC